MCSAPNCSENWIYERIFISYTLTLFIFYTISDMYMLGLDVSHLPVRLYVKNEKCMLPALRRALQRLDTHRPRSPLLHIKNCRKTNASQDLLRRSRRSPSRAPSSFHLQQFFNRTVFDRAAARDLVFKWKKYEDAFCFIALVPSMLSDGSFI